MTISTSHESLDAGSIFIINATTTSTNSFVGLRAVDKRVLLLRSGNDITEKRVRLLCFATNKLNIVLLKKTLVSYQPMKHLLAYLQKVFFCKFN